MAVATDAERQFEQEPWSSDCSVLGCIVDYTC